MRHEVDQFLDSADERGFKVIPVPDAAADPLPRSGGVGLLGVRPAKSPAHTLLPIHAFRHHRPGGDAEPAGVDGLPDVDAGMADDERVRTARASPDSFGDAGFL